jgi:hypothetical protein
MDAVPKNHAVWPIAVWPSLTTQTMDAIPWTQFLSIRPSLYGPSLYGRRSRRKTMDAIPNYNKTIAIWPIAIWPVTVCRRAQRKTMNTISLTLFLRIRPSLYGIRTRGKSIDAIPWTRLLHKARRCMAHRCMAPAHEKIVTIPWKTIHGK